MKGFLNIRTIVLKKSQLEEAFDFLRYAGSKGVEGICLFAGIEEDSIFVINEVIIPNQKSYILEQGLMYAVDGEELHRINIWLYENKMKLIAQIHSHPQEAFHSEADDRYPIVDTYGGISIVIPEFARGKVGLNESAIFRLSEEKNWDKLTKKQIESLFKMV